MGTRDEKLVPWPVDEALESDGDLQRATDFARFQNEITVENAAAEPVACCIMQQSSVVRIRWHAISDDTEAARARMEDVLHNPNWWRRGVEL